jgi:endonuclease/exonuclease/phosphatase family metal-dependent hydrolase
MRLLTYNIHGGIGSGRRYDLERITAVIAEHDPDVVCLQEVDCNVRRSGYHDQPAMLARELKAVASFFQRNVSRDRGGYGNLLLSRWPFHRQHGIPLGRPRREPRGAQVVVVDTPDGPLHLVNWHLGLSETERRWQANHLLGHPLFRQSAHLPTLIAGDANDWLDTLHDHSFRRHHFDQATVPPARFRSFPAFLSLVALDKVFYRGLLVQEAHVVQSPLARRASDHRPLVLDFRLRPEGWQPTPSTNGQHAAAPRSAGLAFGLGWAVGHAAARVGAATRDFWADVQRLRQGESVPIAANNTPAPPDVPKPEFGNESPPHVRSQTLVGPALEEHVRRRSRVPVLER